MQINYHDHPAGTRFLGYWNEGFPGDFREMVIQEWSPGGRVKIGGKWHDARPHITEILPEAAKAALDRMNAISLHQTDRIAPEPFNARHPLTCGNDSNHTPLYPYWNGDHLELICRDCNYTQRY